MRLLKVKTAATIGFILLMASAMIILYTPVMAQPVQDGKGIRLPAGVTPDYTFYPSAYLAFRPNPIGVGQTLLVNVWLVPGYNQPIAATDFKVTFTKPDGTTYVHTLDSYPMGDMTGWFEYVPDQVGNWTIKFESPGQYYPVGLYPSMGNIFNHSISIYYAPCETEEQTLVVQEEMVYSWPPSPLPTDYWTRPVAMENREWWSVLGSYPGYGYLGGGSIWDELYPGTNPIGSGAEHSKFHPWIPAPNTAHIAWIRTGAVSGITGGPAYFYGTSAGPGNPSVVYAGRMYITYTKPEVGSVAACIDIRTGEVYYEIPGGVTPEFIAYYPPREADDPQAQAASDTWDVELLNVGGGRLRKIHPFTGAVTRDVPIADGFRGSGNYAFFVQQIGGYFLDIQDLGSAAGAERYRRINWTSAGSTSNFANRVISNTTFGRDRLGSYYNRHIRSLFDWEGGYFCDATTIEVDPVHRASGGSNPRDQSNILVYSLSTGALLHNLTLPVAKASGGMDVADHGILAMFTAKNKEGTKNAYFTYIDMATGQVLRESEELDYPWGIWGDYSVASAYGMHFRPAYDGIYAISWDTGEVVWKYTAPAIAAFESPYYDSQENPQEVYPWGVGLIADGKLYAWNSEHSESWPRTRGWGLHCINITTGKMIWRINSDARAVAAGDGYLAATSSRTGQMYVFGKGKSATTVTAPKTGIPLGQSVVIEGTVLDMSPAQPGTPCVSADSMTLQMEYLHMQMPITGLWGNETVTGVPVSLDIVDPNGNFFHIADITTDGYSGKFSYQWTPEIEGLYTVMASFNGDDSYGSSFAYTSVGVDEAPEPYPEPPEYGTAEWPEYPEAADDTPMFLGIIAAVVVVAVLVVYDIFFRKRQ